MPMLPTDPFDIFGKEGGLEQFVIQAPTVPSDMDGQTVQTLFEQNPDIEGVVVMENDCPFGIIMRTAFFQKIGTLYGHSIYMKRPVRILVDTDVMKVDISENASQIGIRAMSREQSKLYNYILVYNRKTYVGIISIQMFLVELSKRNEAQISVLKRQQQKLLSAREQEQHLLKDLEYQSSSIQNLLDHADQGFLWFGEDLIIKKECSYKCMSIFNGNISGLSYLELVAPYLGPDKRPVIQLAFESYFKNNSPVTDQVYLMLLPPDCVIGQRHIHFEYRRIENGSRKAVMVVLSDVTEKIEMEKAMEEEQNRQRLLIKAFSCQGQIKQMLEEFYDIFSGGYQNFFKQEGTVCEQMDALFRTVHTFKGDFAQYGFMTASEHLHVFEDKLLEFNVHPEQVTVQDIERVMSSADPKSMLKEDLRTIYEVLGEGYFNQSETLSLSRAKLSAIEDTVRTADGPLGRETILHMLEGLKQKNMKTFLEQYRDYLEYLAGRSLKAMPVYLVEGDDIDINEERYREFLKSLVHIFRNILDHGIEAEEERLECGKSERGVVQCQLSRVDKHWFTLCISDDGRGIDLEKVRQKAIDKELSNKETLQKMTEKEICQLIFADYLSTKEVADTLSGRGMGMSAVQKACVDLGGEIAISTEKNKGTAFQIRLPYIN